MAILTVFTPAYNRAHTLSRTYQSLKEQNCKDFVWLIVDDGSTDNTAEIVKKWQDEESGFDIQYVYKENGGMHTAHNTAYENIHTELNVCIDSDDMMAKDGVEKILTAWEKVRNKGYAGLIALDADFEGYTPLRNKLLACPKTGNDDDFADGIMLHIMSTFSKCINGRPNGAGGVWRAGTGSAMEYILSA